MDSKKILKKIINKHNLTTKETKEVVLAIMQEKLLPSQIGALLLGLRMKGETIDEIIGFIQAMRENMVQISAKNAIDVCGTGGDGSKSFNISTAVAIVAAACGVRVAKHGNRAASSTCGSADVLETLGVNIQLTASQAETVLQKTGIVFLFAPLFHPATKYVAGVRKELKVRTIFNFLGPFLNPASVKKQLIGVPNKDVGEKLIQVGKRLGYKHLVIVNSEDGMDEVSLSAKTAFFTLKNNVIKQFIFDPQKFGFKKITKKAIEEGTLSQNAKFIKDILNGVKGPRRDIVVLNAAVALIVADEVSSLPEGIKRAAEAIDSGDAKKVLANLIKETQKYGK